MNRQRNAWRQLVTSSVVLLALLSVASRAFGDQPRRHTSFASADGRFEARLVSGGSWNAKAQALDPETWGVFEIQTDKLKYTLAARLSPQTVFLSSNGAQLVAVNDYMPWDSEPTVVELFLDGVTAGKYSLADLLPDAVPVSRSASHTHWLIEKPSYDENKGTVVLTTIALDTVTFDTTSGTLVAREKDKRLTADTLFVYGKVRRTGSRKYEIEILCPLHGEVTCGDTVEFRRGKKTPWANITHKSHLNRKLKSQRYASVLVRNGQYVAHDDLLLVNDCSCAGSVANWNATPLRSSPVIAGRDLPRHIRCALNIAWRRCWSA